MKFFNLLLVLFTCPFLFSQGHFMCGTDEMHKDLFIRYPQYNEGVNRAYERLQDHTRTFSTAIPAKSGAAYIIPVVFHVIHTYGDENISDAQILDALKQLNIQYRKQNPDTASIVSQFKSIAADCEIEFRIAQLDPDGNCTSGITRTVSNLTHTGDHRVKELVHWPPHKYLNVYICSQAAGLAGHAMMPAAADTMPQWDGIVMQHSYVGTIGTSEYFRRTVLSHEVGHFLNLQHIWGGNNVPGYYYLPVASQGNCAYDDDVDDTPNTIGWQTCNVSGATCGELDNVQNYMDYAYCGLMFTEGQKTRMHAALNSDVAGRKNLWQPENLIATGTDDETYYLCSAEFMSDKKVVCAGGQITFTDLSLHGVTSRQWEFEGGTATSLSDSVVSVVYSAQGKYAVKITAGNGSSTVEKIAEEYITVLPPQGNQNWLTTDFEYQPATDEKWFQDENLGGLKWATKGSGINQSTCYYLDNFEQPSARKYVLTSVPVNVSGVQQIGISFDFAYARTDVSANESDALYVQLSKDCGTTWSVVRSLSSSALKTVSQTDEVPFVPSENNQWKNVLINTIVPGYKVNNLMVRFVFDNKTTNNIYIDNINVGELASLQTTSMVYPEIEVFPNPASEQIEISGIEELFIHAVDLYDLSGKRIRSWKYDTIASKSLSLDIKGICSGSYLLKINTEKGEKIIHQVIH